MINNTPAIQFGKFLGGPALKCYFYLRWLIDDVFFSDRLPIEKPCYLSTFETSWHGLNLDHLFRGPSTISIGYCTGQCVRRGLHFDNTDDYTTYDLFLRNLIVQKNPMSKKFPFGVSSTCVPVRFKDLKVGVKNRKGKLIKTKVLKNAIVTECGCR